MFGWIDEVVIYALGAATIYGTMVPEGKRKASSAYRSIKYRITGRRY